MVKRRAKLVPLQWLVWFIGGVGIGGAFLLRGFFSTSAFNSVVVFLSLLFGAHIFISLLKVFKVDEINKIQDKFEWRDPLDILEFLGSIGLGVLLWAVAYFAAQTGFLFVPRFQAQVTTETQFLVEIITQFMVVAPAEESLKLALILGALAAGANQYVAYGLSIGFWSFLHVFVAGFGIEQILGAVLAGLLFLIAIKMTGSALAAYFPHATYNILITSIPPPIGVP